MERKRVQAGRKSSKSPGKPAADPPKQRHFNWTKQAISILGTMPDKAAATKLGLSNNAVFSKRVSLGIAPFMESSFNTRFPWKPAALKQLGKVSDHQLAQELGISDSVVTSKRHSLGIGSVTGNTRTRKPWTQRELAMLGRKPDTAVAIATGRGRRHIRAKRESLGIAPFQPQKSITVTADVKKQLGTVSDAILAARWGVAVATVSLLRRKLGIPSSHRAKSKAKGAGSKTSRTSSRPALSASAAGKVRSRRK